eukprot:CAMPEP_0173382212 /NCGR_PEP_ID=MMETSP1356-20130122/4703_1 /TAXON_ID=77927 ORGANISM="Hemiselmis virescens, Strain PCC157" /NCGR_SAMPLE_ID=MMETSP1356 /ASSEMBLY_ACC=CAM_ASM_000847 /LENGTH=358 /DNA_ID=CAMNT_0014336439 /DNA_START=72 /DNA_END=1148 /DNA_ORIENTATION=-
MGAQSGMLIEFLFAIGKALGLILMGFLASRFKYISPQVGLGLSEFVGKVAVPAALFRSLSSLPIFPGQDGVAVEFNVLMCGFAAKFVLFVIAALLGLVLRKSLATCAVFGLVCSLSNDAALGLPILNTTHPQVGASLIFLMTLPCCALLLPMGLAMCEFSSRSKKKGKGSGEGFVSVLAVTLSRVARQPLIASVALAVAYNYATNATKLPRAVDQCLESVMGSLIVSALFALGSSLVNTTFTFDALFTPMILVVLKLLGPGLVCRLTASPVFGFDSSSSLELLSIYSALPAAPIVWAIAREQKADPDAIGNSVVLGTLLCGPVMIMENDGFRKEATELAGVLFQQIQDITGVHIEKEL